MSKIAFANSTRVFHFRRFSSSIRIEDHPRRWRAWVGQITLPRAWGRQGLLSDATRAGSAGFEVICPSWAGPHSPAASIGAEGTWLGGSVQQGRRRSVLGLGMGFGGFFQHHRSRVSFSCRTGTSVLSVANFVTDPGYRVKCARVHLATGQRGNH